MDVRRRFAPATRAFGLVGLETIDLHHGQVVTPLRRDATRGADVHRGQRRPRKRRGDDPAGVEGIPPLTRVMTRPRHGARDLADGPAPCHAGDARASVSPHVLERHAAGRRAREDLTVDVGIGRRHQDGPVPARTEKRIESLEKLVGPEHPAREGGELRLRRPRGAVRSMQPSLDRGAGRMVEIPGSVDGQDSRTQTAS